MTINTEHLNDLPWHTFSKWLNSTESEFWLDRISNSIQWERPVVNLYGKKYVVPRLSYFLAEEGINYKYSGINHYGNGWPDWFIPLLSKVNIKCKTNYNGCLLNLYRNGNDRMGWHSDNEPELDSSISIASLSLGSDRDFFMRNKYNKFKKVITLCSGDLLIMEPICQIKWEHSLPVRKKNLDKRINLTFRRYK